MARLREGAPNSALEQQWLMDDLRSVAAHQGFDLSKQGDLERALEEVDRVHDRIGEDVGLDLTPAQREPIEEKTSRYIQDAIADMRREGFDRASISSRSFDIEDQARAEAKAEVLGAVPQVEGMQQGERAAQADKTAQSEESVTARVGDVTAATGTGTVTGTGAATVAAKSDLARLPAPTDAERAEAYRDAVEERLTPDGIARLKQGDISGLEGGRCARRPAVCCPRIPQG